MTITGALTARKIRVSCGTLSSCTVCTLTCSGAIRQNQHPRASVLLGCLWSSEHRGGSAHLVVLHAGVVPATVYHADQAEKPSMIHHYGGGGSAPPNQVHVGNACGSTYQFEKSLQLPVDCAFVQNPLQSHEATSVSGAEATPFFVAVCQALPPSRLKLAILCSDAVKLVEQLGRVKRAS